MVQRGHPGVSVPRRVVRPLRAGNQEILMKFHTLYLLSFLLFLAGCSGNPATGPSQAEAEKKADIPGEEEREIRASLEKLPPEDRKVAEAQTFCAVENNHRLGVMGTPFKVLVKDRPVFLCCKGCAKKALADPDKTLAKVKELKAGARDIVPGK
jgi:hypothetical protein